MTKETGCSTERLEIKLKSWNYGATLHVFIKQTVKELYRRVDRARKRMDESYEILQRLSHKHLLLIFTLMSTALSLTIMLQLGQFDNKHWKPRLRLSLLKKTKCQQKEEHKTKEFILTKSWGCGKEKRYGERETGACRGRERRRDLGVGKSRLGYWSTHRGGWAIGPGSTPPSFVLTPAAFPPVRVLAVPIAAPSEVEAGRGVAGVVVARRPVFPVAIPVPFPAVVQASMALAVVSVVWPAVWRAVVVAGKRDIP